MRQLKQNERAWRYIGRFLCGFSFVESAVNELFSKLFNLGAGASLLCVGSLDLRRKLKLIEVGLEDQGADHHKDVLEQVHRLADIRNVIAHSPFGPVEEPGEEGIDFNYVNSSGDVKLPHRKKRDFYYYDMRITYAEFDSYDATAYKLFVDLQKIQESLTPICDVKGDLARDIAEIIASSDNVIVFPKKTPREPS